MSIQMNSVSLKNTGPLTVMKTESPESEIVEIGIHDILDASKSEEEIIPDVKGIDIVYHPVCKEYIKSEILESKHYEFVETRVLVKAEDSPFIKTENITQRNKTEDTSDENVTKGTGQAVVEIQASNEHFNVETDEQSVLNFSKNLNGISVRSRKSKSPKKTDFAECYKTDDTTLWEKEKEKIKPVISVGAHEYISLDNDRHVCNHCQKTYKKLNSLKDHIKRMHRKVTTMYPCPYCSYKSKYKHYIKQHIILKHKDTKDIQWFQCHLCEKKFKLESHLTRHNMKVHLRHKEMKDGLDLPEKSYHCEKCNYKTYKLEYLKSHKLTHLHPEEIQYFYCYHCSNKFKRKSDLKIHIFRHHFKKFTQGKRYGCNKCDYETYKSTNLNRHKLTHLKPEKIVYFYCYHCSYKSEHKSNLKNHIFGQHVKQGKRYHCDKCNYKTYASTALKKHKLIHLKPEEVQYFYCYYCSVKAKRKWDLKKHIFKHFKKEEVEFDCYICNFMTPKKESIIKHIKKHSKVQNKSENNEGI